MLKLICLILLLGSFDLIYAQYKEVEGGEFEIYTEVSSSNENNSAKFELFSLGNVFFNNHSSLYPIVHDFDYAFATNRNNDNQQPILVPANKNQFNYGIYHTESYIANPIDNITFANGLYKIVITNTANSNTFIIYIDYRTDNYTLGGNNDIWIKYFCDDNTVKIKWNSSSAYNPVSQFVTYTIWEKKSFNRSVEKLELDLSYSIHYGHPSLSWEEYNYSTGINYLLERNDGYTYWEQIASLSNTNFIDYDVDIHPVHEDVIQYRVKAEIQSFTEYYRSNTILVYNAVLHKIDSIRAEKYSESNFKLYESYPNPFNPTTKISFSIAATDFVTLKIFDSLGRQVAELVNEIKEAGIYDAEFNGSSLSSGIYYYTLTTSNYTQTRKMLLVK